jgi:hypothetical protein
VLQRKAKRRIRKKPRQGYTYSRGTDGVDDKWDIYDPYDRFVESVRFWDETDTDEATEAEKRAKLIVETLNKGYWWWTGCVRQWPITSGSRACSDQ